MPTSLTEGARVTALNQVTTTGASAAYLLSRTRDSGWMSWSYHPGTNKPTAIAIALQTSPDGTDWTTIDGINDPSKGQIRQVPVGQECYVRVNVLSITIGGGDAFDVKIQA